MNRKWLRWYEAQYLKALAYVQVYGCDLGIEQFAAAHVLRPDELEQLREPGIPRVNVWRRSLGRCEKRRRRLVGCRP
jgi:hypothetical protein